MMKSNSLAMLYPFWLVLIYAIVRLFLSMGSISAAEETQLPSAVIQFSMEIHTFASFLCITIFMGGALWLSQYIGRLLLFDHLVKRTPGTFVLLLFTRYFIYLGFLQYLLLSALPHMAGINSINLIIYNIFAGLMLIDYTIFWLELKQYDVIMVRCFKWEWRIMIIQVYRLQVYIVAVLTLMLLCRYFVTCTLDTGYVQLASFLKVAPCIVAW